MIIELIEVLKILLILMCVVVAPIWIAAHYRHKKNGDQASVSSDKEKIEALLVIAERMESRVQTLEAILDKQDPTWRHEL